MRDGKELKPCLSGRGVTKVFGFGDAKTVAVDHVDFMIFMKVNLFLS